MSTLGDLQLSLERVAHGVGAEWGIYVKFVATGEEIAINAETRMDTMSVIKVPLLMELFRQSASGRLDLNHRITLQTRHKRFGTGVLHTLGDGLTLTLRDAATLMIIQSDNTAADMCFDAVGGPNAVTSFCRSLGLDSIEAPGTAFDWFQALAATMASSRKTLSPEQLFVQGYPELNPKELAAKREQFHFSRTRPFGLATARELGRLLEMILNAECAGRSSCDEALRILRLQQFTTRIPRYLFGSVVAHKTGDFEPFIANDVGVIEPYGHPPIVACFLSANHRGIWANLEDAIARMSEKIWAYALSRDLNGA